MRGTGCRRRRVVIGLALALAAAAAAAYLPALQAGFVDFDDPLYVTENAMLQRGVTLDTLRWMVTSKHAYNWHPVTWLSLLLDFELYRLRPAGYHATNILLHAFNAAMLFAVLWRLTRRRWASAMVAALFALHPLHVESVAWISERKDVLSTAFFLLTLWLHAGYARRPGPWRYLAVVGAYAVGLMAKPMLVSLPLLLLLLDGWPLRRLGPVSWRRPGAPPAWRVLLEKAPLAALAAASCVVTYHVQSTTGAVGTFEQYPLPIRVANALVAYRDYLWQMVWPLRLACMYPYRLALPVGTVAAAAVLLGAVTALAAWAWRRAPYLAIGWAWYLISLVPVIGLVQVGNQAMADRYTYIPLIGIFLGATWGIAAAARWLFAGQAARRRAFAALAAAAVVLLALLGWRTWLQARTWKDTITVFEHALAVTERNFLAHNNLANVLPGHGRLDDAIRHYAMALRIRPDYAEAHNNIGVALARRGNLEEAIFHYRQALRLRPDCAETYVNLGTVLYGQQRYDEAIGLFLEAVRLNPYLANAHYNLGIVLAQKGLLAEAVSHFVAALEIRPDMLDAYTNLIQALVRCKEYGKAMIALRAAARLYRAWPPAFTGSLWLLATRADLGAAERAELIRLAEQLGDPARSRDPAFLDALGVAYAGAGRFDEARRAAQRAVALLGAAGADDQLDLVGQRLARYENLEPYVERDARMGAETPEAAAPAIPD